ncbi:MAG: polymer-forming cytoskeletal protein [Clostridia bacterium]
MLKKLHKVFSKRVMLMILATLLAAILLPTIIFGAVGANQQNTSILDAGKTLNGMGFFADTIVRVDGNVEGTVFATGQNVIINGNIKGDLFLTAQTVDINGNVSGNIYCAGQDISLKSKTSGDVFLAGRNITIGQEAIIGRDLVATGTTTVLDGSIERDFTGNFADISINGSIGRDVELGANNISILPSAIIKGDFLYKSGQQAAIATGSKIGGKTDWKLAEPKAEKNVVTPMKKVVNMLLSFASSLFLWFIIKLWKPSFWKRTSEKITVQPLKTIGMGAIALIMTPILTILLMVTVIGIPVGILLFIAYAVALYLSKIIVAVFLGSWLAKRFAWPEIHRGVWLVLLGLLILAVLGLVPILQIIVWLLCVFTGLGAIVAVNYRVKNISTESEK